MGEEDKIELEAWYIPHNSYTGWPSGRFRRTMTAEQPFKVTDPNAILFFNNVAKHNAWLKKITRDQAASQVSKETLGEVDKTKYVINRQFADEKIADLEKDIARNDSVIKSQEKQIVVLETRIQEKDEQINKLLVMKEKYEKLQAKVKKLETALKRKKAESKPSGGN